MPIRHKIQRGECLSTLAMRYGFTDYKAIYDHPDNAELKRKRPDPNIVHPGDVLVIPDKEEKVVDCAAGAKHRFRMKRGLKKLKLKFKDGEGQPLGDMDYTLVVEGKKIEGTTSGAGGIAEDVPMEAQAAELTLAGQVFQLQIGDLNPVDDTEDGGLSGVQARLHNLGIDCGSIDGKMGPQTRNALASFQAENGLKVTGKPTKATLAKLKEIHGC